uniref:hypothetical protein n=1 Tax=Flavobacterium sp. TaxID=239 RepID=UPI00404B327D
EQTFGFFFILFFVKMFTLNVLMKWGFGDIQSGFVNKGVVFFFTRRPCLRTVLQFVLMKMRKKKNTRLW